MRATPMHAAHRPVEWHVAVNDVPIGPIRRRELERKIAAGAVTRESLAWCEGLDDWRPAGEIPELSTLFAPAAQPAPRVTAAPRGMPDAESLSDFPEEQTRVGQSIAAAIAIAGGPSPATQNPATQNPATQNPATQNPATQNPAAPNPAAKTRGTPAAAPAGFEPRAQTFTPPPELVESEGKRRLPAPILLCLAGAACFGIVAAVYVADLIISDDGPEVVGHGAGSSGPLEGDIEIPEEGLLWEEQGGAQDGEQTRQGDEPRDRRRGKRPNRLRHQRPDPASPQVTQEQLAARLKMGRGAEPGGPVPIALPRGAGGGPTGLGALGMERTREIANESEIRRALSPRQSQLSRCASRIPREQGRALRLDVRFQVSNGRASNVRIRQSNSPEVAACVSRVINSTNLSAAGSGRAKTTIILM